MWSKCVSRPRRSFGPLFTSRGLRWSRVPIARPTRGTLSSAGLPPLGSMQPGLQPMDLHSARSTPTAMGAGTPQRFLWPWLLHGLRPFRMEPSLRSRWRWIPTCGTRLTPAPPIVAVSPGNTWTGATRPGGRAASLRRGCFGLLNPGSALPGFHSLAYGLHSSHKPRQPASPPHRRFRLR